jgi:transketolase
MTEKVKNKEIEKLIKIAGNIRIATIEMLYNIGLEYKGHPGPALSIVDILTCLYFKTLNLDPGNPKWANRDRLILSKGHACPALYATLALRGYFDKKHLNSCRHIDSILQGHPDMKKTPGIDMTTGSLGHGLGAAVGMALSAKMDSRPYKTFVILGDGELQEGLVWEAFMAAGHYSLNNLIAIIDRNNWQSCDCIDNTINIEPLKSKIEAFNWDVDVINGHNIEEIINSLSLMRNKPFAIIANTTKGKGVSFMENDNSWHQRPITEEEYHIAMTELKGSETGDRS